MRSRALHLLESSLRAMQTSAWPKACCWTCSGGASWKISTSRWASDSSMHPTLLLSLATLLHLAEVILSFLGFVANFFEDVTNLQALKAFCCQSCSTAKGAFCVCGVRGWITSSLWLRLIGNCCSDRTPSGSKSPAPRCVLGLVQQQPSTLFHCCTSS